MAKKKDTDELFNMMNGIETISTITCTRCDTEDEVCEDIQDAAECFQQEGWRATENHVYCPKCAKKYLKSK